MKKKILALLLILVGFILIGYPIYLKILVVFETKNYNRHYINTSKNKKQITSVEKGKWPETLLIISKIQLEVPIVEVKDLSVFKQKPNQLPGHYPGTALPGEKGNVAIAGHRTGPAGYFKNLNRLSKGDIILLKTPGNEYHYVVEKVFVTKKNDWDVIEPTAYPALTLTSCERVGFVSNAKRLIVRARLLQ